VTAGGHVLAFWEQPDGRLRFVWDGEPGAPFDGLAELRDKGPALFSSDDGAHLAYVGLRGDRMFVGRDGLEDPSFEGFSRSVPPVFSPGGRHLLYGVMVGDDGRLVVDGALTGDLPIAPIAAVFSPDGERLAFVEMRRAADGHDERIVLDRTPGPWFRAMRNAGGAMQFSPDSRRFAYYRVDERGHCQWIVDGRPQRLVDEVRVFGLAQWRRVGVIERPLPAGFSADSRRFAYAADVPEKGVAVIEDDIAGPLLGAVYMPVFSPDSSRLAYVARTLEKRIALVVDGARLGEWDATDTGDVVFSPDSRHIALTLRRSEGRLVRRRYCAATVDAATLAEVRADDVCVVPVFAPDTQRLAWWIERESRQEILVNGDPLPHDAIPISEPRFTATGRLVYAALLGTDEAQTVIVDGRPGPVSDAILAPRHSELLARRPGQPETGVPFSISPDGEHVAWAGGFGQAQRPVVDDRVGPPYDDVIGWSFGADGVATWWAMRGDDVFIIQAGTAAANPSA
jgi:hypothetical protein